MPTDESNSTPEQIQKNITDCTIP